MPGGFGGLLHSGGWQLKRITFVPAKCPDAHSTNPAELGLIPLNDPLQSEDDIMRRPPGHTPKNGKLHPAELFSEKDVVLQWSTIRKTGAGFQNLGNTCFMNAVLQCLTHTPPLAELFLSTRALTTGATNGFDPLGITRDLVQRSLRQRGSPVVSPVAHAKSLRRICRSFRLGRQEDAHEYLVALLDAIHECSIAGMNPKPAPELAHTSFVYRIFAGRIRSQVKCTQCGYESNTYDPFLDLSLEITRANTLERALERFTAGKVAVDKLLYSGPAVWKREVLDGSNKYKCAKEKRLVRAVKRMTVEVAPNVLMIQLKRFEFSLSGHKISKKVDFGTMLDLSPFMSKRPVVPAVYDLYGVLVHSGHSVHSGHYYCFVRSGTGMWHICDDTNVSQVSERMVLGQKAYILFYIKRSLPPGKSAGRPAAAAVHTASPATATAVAAAAAAGAAVSPVANPFQQRQDARQERQETLEQQQAQQQQQPQAQSQQEQQAELKQPSNEEVVGRKRKQRQGPPAVVIDTGKARPPTTAPTLAAAAAAGAAPQQQEARRRKPKQQGAEPAVYQAAEAAAAPAPGQAAEAAAAEDGQLASPFARRLASPAVTRQRQRARLAASVPLLTPSKSLGLEGLATLSRREQRLAELSSLHRTLSVARRQQQRRSGLAQPSQQQQQQQQQGAQGEVSQPEEARTAVAGKGRKAAAANGVDPAAAAAANGTGPSSPSSTSIVSAPDWPPIWSPGGVPAHSSQDVQAQQAQQAQPLQPPQPTGQEPAEAAGAAAKLGRRNGGVPAVAAAGAAAATSAGSGAAVARGAEVKKLLQQTAGGRLGLAEGQWDTVDVETKRLHNRILQRAAPKRRQPDEYDQEYDLGRVKKVRTKAAAETDADYENGNVVAGRVGSRVFDAAWQAKQKGQGGASSNPVQLRGNKLKRQLRDKQQRRQWPP
ncbi:hypothetical protein N2152v2_002108 [Parachlorella kessleri]